LTLNPPEDRFATGSLFAGRYRMIEEIGKGGMGRVFKVYDTKILEKIALKIIRPEIADDARTIAHFRNEIKLARQITHRNVCRMYDLGEDGPTHFITMEFVAGENLRNMIRMTGPLTVEAAVDYARQIADGLAEAHRLGVIHRDLKPHNIMIDESGTVKIMDFGIARSMAAAGATGDGRPTGTPEYMAPEQTEGLPTDERTDIYAVGLILYEMVTGKRPFSGDSPLSLALKHRTETPPPPLALNPALPSALNSLILRCLEKDKARRPQAAGEIAAALETIHGRPSKAAADAASTPSAVPDSARRLRAVRAAAIIPAVVLIAALGYLLFRKSPSRGDSGAAPLRPSPPTVMKNSIAVFPFAVSGGDADLAVLGNGLANDIRTYLKAFRDINVISAVSSERFRDDSAKSEGQAGNPLRVEKFVEGSVLIESGRIRVGIRLIDAATRAVLEPKSYERKPGESFSPLRLLIAGDIAAHFDRQFSPADVQSLRNQDTENNAAYVLVSRAEKLQQDYRDSHVWEKYEEAGLDYKKALDLDPGYLKAFLGLGNLYESRYVQTHDKKDLAAMGQWFQKAEERDPDNSDVQAGLGWPCFYQGDNDGAYRHFKKAHSLGPNNADAYFNAGSFLRSIGLHAQAVHCYARAIALDPLNYATYLVSSTCSWITANYELAESLIQQAIKLAGPAATRAHLNYARILISMKKLDAAEKEIALLERATPMTPDLQSAIRHRRALLLAILGDRTGALALLDNDEIPYSIESTSADSLLGRKDAAILNIKRGHDDGFRLNLDYIYPYPLLISNTCYDGLKNDPRFQEIVAREKAHYFANFQKYGDLGETQGGDSR